ncbi:MAG TPA: 16S rRNA (cytidine(1402)-2'-O)-methyltransferase [Candidatus Binataceae bacterium]|nr:16S rRNA (cytidine(1402)-2'-O)-methyltransferase [Candidatus Binataceae bacterium]
MSAQVDKQTGRGAVLYVVATPLGNPGDLSPRAVETLADVELIACEDTRRTGSMLAAHQIRTPTISYYEHNEERRVPELIERMRGGAAIALVTDAGTPAISDPGYRLVRAAHEAAIRVVAIPGPSAAIAALSVAGLPTDRFVFEGFLPPRDSARRSRLKELATEPRTIVFYEAARRLSSTLEEMSAVFGPLRVAAVVREISKTYEEIARSSLDDLVRRFNENPPLGEVTLVVSGATDDVREEAGAVTLGMLLEAGLSLKQASSVIAKATGRSRREVYQEAIRSRGVEDTEEE